MWIQKGEIGNYHSNPLLSSILYDIEFSDRNIKQYASNLIAQNIWEQVDEEGYSLTKLDTIIDY